MVEYADAELLRKLPLCGHVFHIRCVDSWLENQVTCPVCRIVLTGTLNSKITLSSTRRSAVRPANSVTVEVPAWVLVNRPVPLPPAIATDSFSPALLQSSSSSNSEPRDDHLGVSPLLEHGHTAGWGAVYLENHPHGFSFRTSSQPCIQTKESINHASISERWMTESFVFGISSCDGGSEDQYSPEPRTWRSDDSSSRRQASWSSRSVNSASWDLNQPMMMVQHEHWQVELDDQHEEVLESRVAPFRPLTMSPERCSFEFLPIVTAPAAGDSGFRSPRSAWVGSSRHSFYSHLN